MAAGIGIAGETYISKKGEGERSLHLPRSSSQVDWRSQHSSSKQCLNDLPLINDMLYLAQFSTDPLSCSEKFSIIFYQLVFFLILTSISVLYRPCPGYQSSTTLVFIMKLDNKLMIGYNSLSKLLPFLFSKCITSPQPFSGQPPSDSCNLQNVALILKPFCLSSSCII